MQQDREFKAWSYRGWSSYRTKDSEMQQDREFKAWSYRGWSSYRIKCSEI
jgi:hypothetical protein